ncbi:MAG TPA: FkbM family methyltransferase, partial [Candidatus Angelobacter sp.]|nr:FkbM family methyltransferase [Candidatus Angelobacter sp.]
MSVRDLFNPFFIIGARSCEKSPAVAKLVRRFDFKGKGSVIQRIRSKAMPPREVTAECDGILYRLDLRDDVQREVYFNRYEQTDIQEALAIVPQGGVCIDVGANIGPFALQLAKKVGDSGAVHAFEADPYVYGRLAQNCRLNGFEDRLYCHNAALTNRNGPIEFYRSDRSHSGWGSLVKFSDIAVDSQKVEGITLDSFVQQAQVGKVDLLKIDVEAHEPELLE